MARQTTVWTVLPNGRASEGPLRGRLQVSIVASPRLLPQAAGERRLGAFGEWLAWPDALARLRFELRIGAQHVPLDIVSQPDAALWGQLFNADTPVAGFVFRDMSQVNLRSYAVRNVLGLARRHYARIAVQTLAEHPRLLPWKDAAGGLKDMLGALGTRTQKIDFGAQSIEVMLPGFDRFYGEAGQGAVEQRLREAVFGARSRYQAPRVGPGTGREGLPQAGGSFAIRVLPPDWQNPAANGADQALMAQWRSADEYTLYQADRFYRRAPPTAQQLAQRRPSGVGVPPPPALPEMDFHRMLASYADYPGLLRRLGLVLDAVLPADSPIDALLAQNPQAVGQMALRVQGGPGHDPQDDACPRTAWQADRERFVTRARSSDHERGLLRLRQADDRWQGDKRSAFDVYQCDPDGAALKTVDFLLSAQRLLGRSLQPDRRDGAVTYTTGDRQPLAALRSGGLGVSRHGRAAQVAQGAAAAALKHQAIDSGPAAAAQVVLFAEDLLRGYRVDVQPDAGAAGARWHSLCRRVGSYWLTGSRQPIELPPDEGYVKGASTSSGGAPASDPDDHYLHESLFRWAGWSLVAPRPGRTLRAREDAASGVQGEQVEDVSDELSDGGSGVAARFTVAKGSLPKLRFGTLYRLRARLVDLAGNSLAPDDASLDGDPDVSEPAGYWRFEPVDPPALVQRARVSEGESLERLVIRSNAGSDPEAYLGTADFVAASAGQTDFDYLPRAERHLVPPKASQLLCETHGAFDGLWSNPADIKAAYAIAAREAGTLYDELPGAQVKLITPSALAGVATTTAVPPRLPSPGNPTGDRLAAGQYVIHAEARLRTPYLPDPAAGGVALRALPGHALPGVDAPMTLGAGAEVVLSPQQELVLLVAHGKAWPDSEGFRLVLAEQPAELTERPCQEVLAPSPPRWDADARELTLFVPKGRIVRLRYASFVDKALLPSFGIPRWVDDAAARARLLASANLGCAWALTPWRPLTLVHATQQPICEPELIKLGTTRQPGDQHALLRAQLRLHGPSTGKFEIEASWKEYVDDPEQPGPQVVQAHGTLSEVLLAENHPNEFALDSAVAANHVDPARPRAPGNRHEFGDTRFRLVAYRVRAATRFREYLPPALYADPQKVTRLGPVAEGVALQVGADDDFGAPVLAAPGVGPHTVVLASAPPDDPRVLYTLPTFRWQRSDGAGAADVTRIGNGLRVWLERPWFSAGNGELLGVLLLPGGQPFQGMADRLTPYVTQWGMDPLWDSARPDAQARPGDFPGRVADEELELRELPGQRVHVVGHRVRWHAGRRLWYGDIELEPGRAYMPFVRLALVRYQPHALRSARISKVVLAEFAQLLPRRRARLTRQGDALALSLWGRVPAHGPMQGPRESAYAGISLAGPFVPQDSGRNRAELVLQLRDADIDSDLAWQDAAVLASSLLPPPAAAPGNAALPGSIFDAVARRDERAAVSVQNRLGERIDFERMVELGGALAGAAADGLGSVAAAGAAVGTPVWADPLVWQASATLPPLQGRVARLALREYERYYTDRTVPERQGDATRRRRVVEERLVFTTLFALADG